MDYGPFNKWHTYLQVNDEILKMASYFKKTDLCKYSIGRKCITKAPGKRVYNLYV